MEWGVNYVARHAEACAAAACTRAARHLRPVLQRGDPRRVLRHVLACAHDQQGLRRRSSTAQHSVQQASAQPAPMHMCAVGKATRSHIHDHHHPHLAVTHTRAEAALAPRASYNWAAAA